MRVWSILFVLCLFSGALFSCSTGDETQGTAEKSSAELPVVTMMTHDSFSISKEVVKQFEETVHAQLVILKAGDAGEALNKAILSKNNPLADIFYGVDNTFLSRALKAEMFLPYKPKHLDNVAENLHLDPQNRLVPVDFGDVCLNYDSAWFKEHHIQPPAMLEDLLKPEYKALTVVENPATSSPGLAFLLATISRFGEDGYLDYWQKLKANEVEIASGWKDAYWGKFTAASSGDRPIVVSYASSPAAEVFYSETKLSQAPTGVVIENGSAFRQIEFAGILKGTSHLELAKRSIDFILSTPFQEDIPLQMFVFPANTRAVLPPVFQKYAKITNKPALLDSRLIDRQRDQWLQEWTEKML